MTPDALLALFTEAADATRDVVGSIAAADRRARTDRPGQYALDLVADEAVLDVLRPAGVAVVSEESGASGPADAPITVVVDPVDGSTNCSRGIPYWAISLCAVDAEGPLCALVRNQATGATTTAVRGKGAFRDGEPIVPSAVRRVGNAVVNVTGMPARRLRWKQFRALGSAALALCDLAAGTIDGYVDAFGMHAPWDYLGGLLACTEAGATIVDAGGQPLVVTDPAARRQLIAAGTPELLAELRGAVAS